jgi:DNA-binding Lrp family transcriptional regulator
MEEDMHFFVFIGCAPGKTSEVGVAISQKALPQVQEIYSVSGDWDLLVRVQFSGRDFETDVIENMLADQWDNVRRTHTVIGYRVYNPDDASF